MPRCFESAISRKSERQKAGASLTREFFVTDQPDPAAADALIDVTAETTFLGLDRKGWSREEIVVGHWRYTVLYGASANGNAGLRPDQLTFRLGVAQRHITQAKESVGRFTKLDTDASGLPRGTNLASVLGTLDPTADGYLTKMADVGQYLTILGGTNWVVGRYKITGLVGGADGGNWIVSGTPAPAVAVGGSWILGTGSAPDNKAAIGLTRDTVQGADVPYPILEFSLASPVTTLTFDTLRALRGIVGTTNNAAWNGFAAGELLYLGVEPTSPVGSLGTGEPQRFWNLAHSFRYEPNRTNVRVGDIVVPFVGGHEYLWARYGGGVAAIVSIFGFPAFVETPVAVYVDRVADSSNFDTLGIVL